MKLKKLLAFGLALVMCLAMAACGANPDEKPEESTSQTDASWLKPGKSVMTARLTPSICVMVSNFLTVLL